MLKSFSAKKKFYYVDGTLSKLLTTDSSFEQWKQCDDMVSFWTMNVFSLELATSGIYANTT